MNAQASDKLLVVLAVDAVGQTFAQTRQAKYAEPGREHATGALTGSFLRVTTQESVARFDHPFSRDSIVSNMAYSFDYGIDLAEKLMRFSYQTVT